MARPGHRTPRCEQPHSLLPGLQGNGVVVFKFPNIVLPDSNAGTDASQGFVKFRVSQRKDVQLERKSAYGSDLLRFQPAGDYQPDVAHRRQKIHFGKNKHAAAAEFASENCP